MVHVERIWLGHWFGSVLCFTISALTLFSWCWEGHPACTWFHFLIHFSSPKTRENQRECAHSKLIPISSVQCQLPSKGSLLEQVEKKLRETRSLGKWSSKRRWISNVSPSKQFCCHFIHRVK